MKILIYGAGVIGSLYAVLFSNAGYYVSVYARGERLHFLQTRGLLYRKDNKIQKGNIHILDTLRILPAFPGAGGSIEAAIFLHNIT